LYEKHFESKRPNKHTDRVAWNNHFERGITLTYASFYEMIPLESCPSTDSLLQEDIAEINLEIASGTQELMSKEGVLAALAVENLIYGNFETEWKKLDVEKRRTSHWKACIAAPVFLRATTAVLSVPSSRSLAS
jgi:hypothetical protein